MTNLWPHQLQTREAIVEAIAAGHRRIVVACPTGGGKTVMMLDRMEYSSRPTCLYTNRTMLLEQLSKTLTRDGFSHGIRAAGHKPRLLDDIQLAMVQTEASQVLERERRDVHRADEVFWDEVHNNVADTSLQLRDKHGDCIDIGWTATPLGLGHVYNHLIVAANNSELRACGAHVPAYTYGPDEPDTKLVGKIAIGEGECGIGMRKRAIFAQRVFGRVVDNYHALNPEHKPALLFAPGVAESIWFAEQLNEAGIPAAHIDGENCWIDGSLVESSNEVRDEIAIRSESGSIKIVCNRFVLREGIDWPWIYHGIFATVFGSLTSFLQAGGRLLRSHPSMDHVIVQDHGGNFWRHGSLNANREWSLELTDRIVSNLRLSRIREQKDPEPIHCPKCNMMRTHGKTCPACGYAGSKTTRPVLQADGSLREMKNDTFRKRRRLSYSDQVARDWIGRIKGIRSSKKETVQTMTFAQAEVSFARDHNWQYPPRDMPMMPKRDIDWFLPVKDVPRDQLT